MELGALLAVGLSPIAVWLALIPLVDMLALAVALLRPRPVAPPPTGTHERLLFLVPAHDEELLIDRCVDSLRRMRFPPEHLRIVVVADNCSDQTAAVAARRGARVLVRTSADERGKGHAIGWALEQLPLHDVAAVVIVDADTIVEPDYAEAVCAWSPLREKVLQTYDGLSNEFETALTRMAGLLTRNRYGTTLRLKARAGLNCPLTGDGVVLGTGTLARFPWRVATITEGWELYTRFTVAGQQVCYASAARLYAQETSSIASSRTQRQRWASGRLAVLRRYLRAILTSRRLSLLQRLDLVAELSNLGPVTHCAVGVVGAGVVIAGSGATAWLLAAMFVSPLLHQMLLSAVSLRGHPEPLRTLAAFTELPRYALWRLGVAFGVLARRDHGVWIRTERH
jgi:cellulose synthase/poly-beta-1,6-N-acetylglucosamine synthase-like glycosyltransferase